MNELTNQYKFYTIWILLCQLRFHQSMNIFHIMSMAHYLIKSITIHMMKYKLIYQLVMKNIRILSYMNILNLLCYSIIKHMLNMMYMLLFYSHCYIDMIHNFMDIFYIMYLNHIILLDMFDILHSLFSYINLDMLDIMIMLDLNMSYIFDGMNHNIFRN